jgi:predicted RNA-binding protein YlqC (UPF0109 family)
MLRPFIERPAFVEELIAYIAKSLVDDPAQVKVARRSSGGTTVIELRVAQEDTGRVIGKGGNVANAMRALLRASAHPKSNRVILKIL